MMEIERKFLVEPTVDGWREAATRKFHIRQGYFEGAGEASVRVRITDDAAYLTIKGAGSGLCRPEFQYRIPVADAETMMDNFCKGRVINKWRYLVPAAESGLVWEIDEYLGMLEGHFTAELEIPSPDFAFTRPDWLGEELTGDPRYLNASLALAQRWPDR